MMTAAHVDTVFSGTTMVLIVMQGTVQHSVVQCSAVHLAVQRPFHSVCIHVSHITMMYLRSYPHTQRQYLNPLSCYKPRQTHTIFCALL